MFNTQLPITILYTTSFLWAYHSFLRALCWRLFYLVFSNTVSR